MRLKILNIYLNINNQSTGKKREFYTENIVYGTFSASKTILKQTKNNIKGKPTF